MKRAVPISALFVLITLLFSCSDASEGAAQAARAAAEDITEIEAVTLTADFTAVVVFLLGDVEVNRAGRWRAVEIGEDLEKSDRLRTAAASTAEIQIADMALLVVEEETEILLSALDITPESDRVEIELAIGSVLNRVNQLGAADSYRIRSNSAIAGVRGTSFRVSSDADGVARVAVLEGEVRVLPAPQELKQALEAVGDPEERDALLVSLEDRAPAVGAGEEAAVDSAMRQESAEQYRQLARDIAAGGGRVSDPEGVAESLAPDLAPAFNRRPIGADQSAQLAALENRRLITADTPGGGATALPIVIDAEADDARIFVDGELRGLGQISLLVPRGERLVVRITREGFRDYEWVVSADEGAGRRIRIELIPEDTRDGNDDQSGNDSSDPQAAGMSSPPQTAAATDEADGESAGQTPSAVPGSGSEVADPSGPASGPAGSRPGSMAGAVKSASDPPDAGQVRLNLSAPEGAAISVNGAPLPAGQTFFDGMPGDRLTVVVEARGFRPQSREYVLRGEGRQELRFALERLPLIAGSSAVSRTFITGELVPADGGIILADANGTVYMISRDLKTLWTRQTANRGNENSSLISDGASYYFSGSRELVGGRSSDGLFSFRLEGDGESVSVLGRYPLIFGASIALPRDDGFALLRRNDGAVIREVSTEGFFQGSPAAYSGMILMATDRGELLAFDPGDGSVAYRISAKLSESIAVAPLVVGNRAFVADVSGRIAAFDLTGRQALWNIQLDHGEGIFQDLLWHDGLLFAFSFDAEEIQVISAADGAFIGRFPGAASPPAMAGDLMIYATLAGELRAADPRNVEIVSRRDIGATVSARPLILGERIYLGTEDGRVIAVNPDVFLRR
jgi:outer membrane protein assembly factor BamB